MEPESAHLNVVGELGLIIVLPALCDARLGLENARVFIVTIPTRALCLLDAVRCFISSCGEA